jgi:hypothetical protein
MSRGTDANLAYVFTVSPKHADPAPGPRPAPELARHDEIQAERAGNLAPATPTARRARRWACWAVPLPKTRRRA